jgi:hypothetical protein
MPTAGWFVNALSLNAWQIILLSCLVIVHEFLLASARFCSLHALKVGVVSGALHGPKAALRTAFEMQRNTPCR